MKTITLHDDATITVDGKEYVPKGTNAKTPERVLWTPEEGEMVSILGADGKIRDEKFGLFWQEELDAGNVFPAEGDYDLAAKRHREAQSIIDRYCYAKGIDTRWKDRVTQWCVWQNHDNALESYFTTNAYGNPFCVETKAIAEQIIADCGDEIRMVLLRGVE